MRHFIMPSLLLTAALVPAPAAAETLTPAVQRDLKCFMLYAMGVDHAVKAKDEKVQQAAGLGLTYFLGKLKIEAPTIVLADSVRQEADSLKDDAATRSLGDSCDQEFQKAGAELRSMGEELANKADAAPAR